MAGRSKRGSMVVEAAIFFPIFICAVITLIVLIKACLLQIIVFGSASDQIRLYSSYKVIALSAGINSELEDHGVDSSNFRIKSHLPCFAVANMDNMEKISFTYETQIKMPISLANNIYLDNAVATRRWQGSEIVGNPFGFERMKTYEDGVEVFVFPRAGERFHTEGCRYIKSFAEKVHLSDAVMSKYDACPLCTDGNETLGQTVFIFQYGSSYHERDCSAVEKYVISMDKRDAEIKGYSACSVCGG